MTVLNIKGFPDHLYKKLQRRAALDRRSLAQEVIFLLEMVVEEEKSSILELKGLGKKRWMGIDVSQHIQEERDSWE